jgi:hypothetical protein
MTDHTQTRGGIVGPLLLAVGLATAGWFVGHGFVASRTVDRYVTVKGVAERDVLANAYRSGPTESRFIINQVLMVRSDQPQQIRDASQSVGELVAAGVVLSASGGPGYGPTFLFTRLNDLKPEMIAEATASARRAAEQFASDSSSRLGGIRRANQGVFVILPRDRAMGIDQQGQLNKTLRVVSTISYYLED